MNITEQKFYSYVPAATNPEDCGIFDMVQDALSIAKSSVSLMLGQALYDRVAAAQDDEINPLYTLCCLVERYICLDAFERAIPSLDLVLTPTGFGVVSNANVAPASADRVARLARETRNMKECAFDDILDELRGNEDWCETEMAKYYFRSLIWSGSMVKYFGFPTEYRTKLYELMPQIEEAERALIQLISPEFHRELTEAIRTRRNSSQFVIVADICRNYIYTYVAAGKDFVNLSKATIISYLDRQIEFFPTYAASSAYQANHFKPYENEQKDSCFFFG